MHIDLTFVLSVLPVCLIGVIFGVLMVRYEDLECSDIRVKRMFRRVAIVTALSWCWLIARDTDPVSANMMTIALLKTVYLVLIPMALVITSVKISEAVRGMFTPSSA